MSSDGELAEFMEVVRMLDALDGERRRAGLRLFGSMRTLLAGWARRGPRPRPDPAARQVPAHPFTFDRTGVLRR